MSPIDSSRSQSSGSEPSTFPTRPAGNKTRPAGNTARSARNTTRWVENTTRSAGNTTESAEGTSGGGSAVVVGGYGAVGEVVTLALAARGQRVTVAGRDLARAQRLCRERPDLLTARRFDVDAPDDLDLLLEGAAVLVMCVERGNERIARACLERGIHYVDISATAAVLDRIERLDPSARRSGAAAVLSVGLAPGLTNVLARGCVERLPSATSGDVSILLGLSGDHGPESVRWTFENLAVGRSRSGVGRRKVVLPGFGRRTLHPFPFSDQYTLTRTLRIPVTTRVCFDSAAVTAALFGLRALGLFRLVDRLGATGRLAATSSRLRLGSDRFVVQTSATDSGGARVTYAVSGRQECYATGVVAAYVAEHLLRQPVAPGVHHIDQVIDTQTLLRALRRHDLTVHQSN